MQSGGLSFNLFRIEQHNTHSDTLRPQSHFDEAEFFLGPINIQRIIGKGEERRNPNRRPMSSRNRSGFPLEIPTQDSGIKNSQQIPAFCKPKNVRVPSGRSSDKTSVGERVQKLHRICRGANSVPESFARKEATGKTGRKGTRRRR